LHAEALEALALRRGGAALAAALPSWSSLEECLSSALAPKSRFLLVGLLSTTLVGVASGSASDDASAVLLELFYVSPNARRHGIARALYREVERWALLRGLTRIETVALPGDRALKSFLEAYGLRARLLVLEGPLGDPYKTRPRRLPDGGGLAAP
jgi:GNAT superfamily N-acetyltransferase